MPTGSQGSLLGPTQTIIKRNLLNPYETQAALARKPDKHLVDFPVRMKGSLNEHTNGAKT